MTTFTKATLILGTDEKGNEMGYFQSEGDWYNLQSEMKVTPRFIVNHIYPLVLLVRFGDEPMSVYDWKMCGWPVELAEEELAGLRLLNDGKSLEADQRTDQCFICHNGADCKSLGKCPMCGRESADPRTDEQRDLDEWQAETEATRMSDYPI